MEVTQEEAAAAVAAMIQAPGEDATPEAREQYESDLALATEAAVETIEVAYGS